MNHLQTAVKLANFGFAVFALSQTGKPHANCKTCYKTCEIPQQYEECCHLVCHAAYAATTEVKRLGQMWHLYEDSLIGIRTGRASRIVVLDFDQHEGGANGLEALQEWRKAGALPLTVAAATGGGGVHLYYKHPMTADVPNDNRGKLAPGVDVKSDGGFVVAPDSKKRGAKEGYRWYPGKSPWDIEIAELPAKILATITREPDSRFVTSGFTVNLDKELTREFRDALVRLSVAGVGSRNELLHSAACRAGEAVAAGGISLDEAKDMLFEAGTEAGLRYNEIQGTTRSGMARGMRAYQEAYPCV